MAKQSDSDFLTDGIGAIPGGMNSGIVPQLLDKSQVAFATNCTFRGGFIRNRPGLRKVTLDFGDDALLQSRFENSIFQGAAFFKSEYGAESIVASIGGRVFDIKPSPVSNSATVEDVSITDDVNSSGNAIAWIWQSERWAIINDGQSLPIFYDGANSRRSYGPSQTVGITSLDFAIPDIGETVAVTLTDLYEGPYNTTLYVGGFIFQINPSASSGYPVTLKNISATPGASVAASQQLLFPTNLIAYLTAPSTEWILPNHLRLTTTPIPYAFESADTITIHRGGNQYTSGVVFPRYPGSFPVAAGSTLWDLASVNSTDTIPAGSPIYSGFIQGSQPSGMITSTGFIAPALGSSVETTIAVPYTGPLPANVVIGGDLYEITAAGAEPIPSPIVNLTNVNGTSGATIPAGSELQTIPELPVSRMGAYGLGRNWVSLPDGRSFIGGDIVGGSSGTPALSNRDAVLHTTENDYLFGGGSFVVPGNVGDIRSMTFSATLDVSLGQGPLQVGTPTSFFSCQAPVDRTIWQSITNPILTQSLIGKGPLGQYGTVLVNSDILFRARDGLGSLILARREFDTWGNTPISREMQRVIDVDNQALLENSTAVQFDNRLLMGCLPFQGPLGVYHQGLIALNFDPVSSLRGKTSSIYDGLWTGIQAFQFVTGQFSGDERSFAFCYNSFSNRIELFELLQSGEGEFDNDGSPMTWSFETSSLFLATRGKGPFDLAKLVDGEMYISDIEGIVQIQTWYRPDYSECWIPWHSFGICASSGPKQYRSRLGLGKPSETDCDPATNRPFCIGNNFQVRVQVTGACKFMGLLLKAVPEWETKFSVPICKPLCDTLASDSTEECEPCADQGICETFDLVFYNLSANKSYSNGVLSYQVECPNGTTRTVYIAAGRINFTLPFPPDYDGTYPPLIMGCAAGGVIIRTIPDGSSQEAIDAIVDEMITTCGRAIAETEVQCNIAPPSYFNVEVYFDHSCGVGQYLTYNGTLPSWITLDQDNSRLVGSAGLFSAASQSEADAIAQNLLDEFANAALTSGDLDCTAAPQWENTAWTLYGELKDGTGPDAIASGVFSGASFDVEAKRGTTGNIAGVRCLGTLAYAGPETSCKVTVTANVGSPFSAGFLIQQDGVTKLSVTQADIQPAGVFIFPFTIAATAGSSITIIGRTDDGAPSRYFIMSTDNTYEQYSALIENIL